MSLSSPDEDGNRDKTFEEESIQICLTLQSELHNIGKSLSCPLCLCTLRKPTLLPCNHAFCKACLATSFDPKHNRTISPQSGKHVYRNQCPICKVPCTKRGMQESEHLAGLVKAYKKTLRSFGLTPIVYDDKVGIAMTQIEETVDFDLSLDPDKNLETKSKESAPTLRQCHEHLEVSKGIHEQLKRAMKSMQHSNEATTTSASEKGVDYDEAKVTSAEELERINKIRKLDFLLKDQEKVVKVDERALVRAAVSTQKRRSKSNEQIVTTLPAASVDALRRESLRGKESEEIESQEESKTEYTDALDETLDLQNVTKCTVQKEAHVDPTIETSTLEAKDNLESDMEFENTQHRFHRATSAIEFSLQVLAQAEGSQSQTFFSAPDQDSESPSNDNRNDDDMDQPAGNNVIGSTQDLMDDAREKEAADRSGEWLEQDLDSQRNDHHTRNQSSVELGHYKEGAYDPTRKLYSVSQNSYTDNFLSANSDQHEHNVVSKDLTRKEQHYFPKGTIVQVSDRTWPGVNKLGGVARIVKVHTNSDAGVKYDVAYVLGGREKMVDSSFVTIHNDEKNGSFTSDSTPKRHRADENVDGCDTIAPLRKSRRVNEKKLVEEWIAKLDAEEACKAEKAESNDGVSPPSIYSSDIDEKAISVHRKKENESPNEIHSCETFGNEDIADKTSCSERNDERTSDLLVPMTSVDDILKFMNFKDIFETSMSYYTSRLKMAVSEEKGARKTFFITTSSLSETEQGIVRKMAKELSTDRVKIKLLKDFNPFKTNILVTSTSGENISYEKVAKLRTMKAMRSALIGIPIVDVSWCHSCLDAKKIVLEKENCITLLPTKVSTFMNNVNVRESYETPRDFSTASFGVLSLASCLDSSQRQRMLLFENTQVFLAGKEWKNDTTKAKDVQLLLKEGGGSILSSASHAIKSIEEHTTNIIVILCDDSDADSCSGITTTLADAVRKRHNCSTFDHKSILVVDSKWLFDSISCAKLLEANSYKPATPIALSLWKLCK